MSSLPGGYRAVDVPESRREELLGVNGWAFPTAVTADQGRALPLPLTWDRTRGVEAPDGELVAIHSSFPFSAFPVPGGRLPVTGLTWVGVHPGHRRRGLLRAMIAEHFSRGLARGEAVSALFAAEPAIYGRFGYGLAARELRLSIPRGATLREVPGVEDVRLRIERLDPAQHGPTVHALHSSVDRPGWATRETPELRETFLADPEQFRDGAESARIVLAERAGMAVGYALFRRKLTWETAGPRGTVRVHAIVATDPAVGRALWGALLDLDLMTTTEVSMLAVDDPITHLLVDPRAAQPRVVDNVWVRLLDVRRALAGRRYTIPLDLVIKVTDTAIEANRGRWRLVGGPEGATVEPTTAQADIALDVRELGAAYLGGTSLSALTRAGLATELTTGAADTATTAFGWPDAPVCGWVF